MSERSAEKTPTLTCILHDAGKGPSAAELVARLKEVFGADYVVTPLNQTSPDQADEKRPVVLRFDFSARATAAAAATQPSGVPHGRALKMLVQCELLDSHGVGNGAKAIDIALSRLWAPSHIETYGAHDNPASIKRWRIERGSPGRRSLRAMESRQDARSDRRRMPESVRSIRRRYAQDVVRRGSSMREGYKQAILVTSGALPGLEGTSAKRVAFSYATFRRDCLAEVDRAVESKGACPWPNRRRRR